MRAIILSSEFCLGWNSKMEDREEEDVLIIIGDNQCILADRMLKKGWILICCGRSNSKTLWQLGCMGRN